MIFTYQNNIFGEILQEIKKAIKGTRYENHVFLVGGAVRDSLLGKPMKDIDLCVDLPNGGISFAEWICHEYGCDKINSNPCIFPKYGTAKFHLKTITKFADIPIECVQTRKEQYHENSRNPETVFGTLEEDCLRRDLTINSLYVNLTNDCLIDPCGNGLDDLHNCIIKTPSQPDIIFEDDPLRMLRVIRFATKLEWGINKNTWLGIVKNAYRVGILSKERICDELNQILLCDKPSVGIIRLAKCGLLEKILPEVYQLIGVTQGYQHFGDVFEHTMATVDKTAPITIHRWAGLLHDIGKPSTKTLIGNKIRFFNHDIVGKDMAINLLKRLKFSNSDINKISLAVKHHMRFKSYGDSCPSPKVLRRFVNEVGENNLAIILDVIDADNKSHAKNFCIPNQVSLIIERLKSMQNDNDKSLTISLPINGHDIIDSFNLKPSPKIGQLLQAVQEFIIDNPNATKEDCLDFVSDKIKGGI